MLMTSYVAKSDNAAHVLITFSGISASLTRRALSQLVGVLKANWSTQSQSQSNVA